LSRRDRASAAGIANAMPPAFVSNGLTTKTAYIAELAQDKGQFLPDGHQPGIARRPNSR